MLWASDRGGRILLALAICLVLATGCKRAKPPRTVSWPTNLPSMAEPSQEAPPPPAASSGGAETLATPTPATSPTPESVAEPPAPGDASASEVVYTVAPGDTLSSIAEAHQTTIWAIMQKNGLSNPDLVRLGQELTIPVGSASSGTTPDGTAAPETVYHTVGRGDTLWNLARRYQTHPREIVAQNGELIKDPDHLTPGMTLKIQPGSGPVVTTHTVKPGENLASIARAYRVEFQALLRANGLANPNLVRAGQLLVIPK